MRDNLYFRSKALHSIRISVSCRLASLSVILNLCNIVGVSSVNVTFHLAHLAFILVKDEKLGEIHASYSQVFHALCDLSCIMPLLIGANLLANKALSDEVLSCTSSFMHLFYWCKLVQINSNRF